ncbi:MAG: extracellular solute-binding protein [Chloroflexi bacterium]|nr:extracellular solute-binding protein [Chloroflexota bacterium]
MKRGLLSVLCLLSLLVFAGCREPAAPPAPSPGASAGVSQAARAVGGWEAVVAAAQKEGRVAVYGSSIVPAQRDALITAFKQRYGMDIEFTTGGSAEIAERLSRETRAGLNIADVGMFGPSTITTSIKPLGTLELLEPLLLLPEVTDGSKWRGGKIPYYDQGKQVISLIGFVSPSVTINTELVRPGEIGSYYDLLAPKWKGQIVLNDPTTGGGGGTWFGVMVRYVMGMERGVAFMRDLARQEPIMSRDHRQMIEWVAKAKYPVAIGINQEAANAFTAIGAPVSQPRLKEPFHVAFGSTNVITFQKVSHLNARTLFVNWILSQEGASIVSRTYGAPSRRTDVSMEGIDPAFVPTPQDILLDENYYKGQTEDQKLAGQVFASLLRK